MTPKSVYDKKSHGSASDQQQNPRKVVSKIATELQIQEDPFLNEEKSPFSQQTAFVPGD